MQREPRSQNTEKTNSFSIETILTLLCRCSLWNACQDYWADVEGGQRYGAQPCAVWFGKLRAPTLQYPCSPLRSPFKLVFSDCSDFLVLLCAARVWQHRTLPEPLVFWWAPPWDRDMAERLLEASFLSCSAHLVCALHGLPVVSLLISLFSCNSAPGCDPKASLKGH